jgi:hypothetical protein
MITGSHNIIFPFVRLLGYLALYREGTQGTTPYRYRLRSLKSAVTSNHFVCQKRTSGCSAVSTWVRARVMLRRMFGQSVDLMFVNCLTFTVLSYSGALSDERSGLSFSRVTNHLATDDWLGHQRSFLKLELMWNIDFVKSMTENSVDECRLLGWHRVALERNKHFDPIIRVE